MVPICPWETGREDAVGLLLVGTAGWQQKNEWKVCGTSQLSLLKVKSPCSRGQPAAGVSHPAAFPVRRQVHMNLSQFQKFPLLPCEVA